MRKKSEKMPQSSARSPRLLPTILVVCFVLKAILAGVYLYYKSGSFPWPPPAHATNSGKVSTGGAQLQILEPPELANLLAKKEQQLLKKEEERKQREQELLVLKQEVSSKLEELQELQEKIEKDLEELQSRKGSVKDKRIKHLAEVYKAMEPARAARLMEKLDEHIVVQIISRMRGRAAGQIL